MSGQHTNTTLIECNRLFSEEVKGGNTTQKALFTNKTNPIHLKEGDQISLHSGYIAEIGAGGQVIEFTGKKTNKEYTLSYTNTSGSYPDKYLPYGFEKVNASNIEKTFEIQDNKAAMQINYYTNLNGDCHILLPRRFDKQYLQSESSDTHYKTNWTSYDSYDMGEVRTQPNIQHQLKEDWQNFHRDDTLLDIRRKRRVDNSRMKLYYKDVQAYAANNNTSDAVGVTEQGGVESFANPIFYNYRPYQDIVEFELDKGYDTPSNIALSMTNTMTKTGEPTPINASVGTGATAFYKEISTRLESATYKSFHCANEDTFSSITAASYIGQTTWNENAAKWLSCYNYIGVKRPEFFDNGRAITGDNGFAYIEIEGGYDIAIADRAIAEIVTNQNWDAVAPNGKKILEGFRDWFKSQKLYPEFWDYDYKSASATINTSRFVHMSSKDCTLGELGSDNYTSATDATSCPVFIYFDEDLEDTYTDGVDDDLLCYGFAKQVGGKIAFTTKKIGGIPTTQTTLFHSTNKIPALTALGYDWNNSAYGNSHCILYSGFLREAIDDAWEYQDTDGDNTLRFISDKLHFTYLGAKQPLINFDQVGNRFTMSYLHTPERVGQQFKAGLNDEYPVVADADEECYKLNKTPSHYTFTPDMKPYFFDFTVNIDGTVKRIYPHNFNFGRFRITDSQTGLFIESFGNGITEENYSDTLWFKLGFSYNQLFTPEKDLRNCQTRIDSITDPNTTLITTNADVLSGNSTNFNVNIFSSEMYSAQCPLTQNAAAQANQLTVPSVTVQTQSAVISADNLPVKTTRPYFIIRTSLLGEPTFQGGQNSNELYPVIAVVNKINGYSDFFSLEQNQILYTVTKAMTITQITSSIHDPDQTLSEVDDSSSLIYKIIRNRNQPNLLQNILSNQK
jgi:hypothetical protein